MGPEWVLASVIWGAFFIGFAFNQWGRKGEAYGGRIGHSIAMGVVLAILALPLFALASITASLASIANSLGG